MKQHCLSALSLAMLCGGYALAQTQLLPDGQSTRQPWTASYQFLQASQDLPSEHWYATDYDDAAWPKIQGPISTESDALAYYVTTWANPEGTYLLRRHFSIDKVEDIRSLRLDLMSYGHAVFYLNGQQVWDPWWNWGANYMMLPNEQLALLSTGDNVLAVSAQGYNEQTASIDFGLSALSLVNGDFHSSYEGWTGSWYRSEHNGFNFGYHSSSPADCHQSLEGEKAGLYCLSANACGLTNTQSYRTAYQHRHDELPTGLFIGDAYCSLPSAFDEPSDTETYYAWKHEGKYISYDPYAAVEQFAQGDFRMELWHYYDPAQAATLDLGIRSNEQAGDYQWSAWANMSLAYYSEAEVAGLAQSTINDMNDLAKKPQQRELSAQTTALVSAVQSSNGTAAKAQALAQLKNHEFAVRKSVKAYEELAALCATLDADRLHAAATAAPATVAEAIELSQQVATACSQGMLDAEGVRQAKRDIQRMQQRLTYTYLDIAVAEPGEMGDLVLARVNDFVDVVSLKLSGRLNDKDIETLRQRMTSLREIDLSGVDMTMIPEDFFYDRRLIEKVVLPAQIEVIGRNAFSGCKSLRSIDFPGSLRSIRDYAFYDCDSLQQVILNDGLTQLDNYAFYSCEQIRHISLPSSLHKVGYSAFSSATFLEEIEFAEGLTEIGAYAFDHAYSLRSVKFPSTLRLIDYNAFANCTLLSEIDLNEGLYRIGDNAFYETAITEITLPSTLVLCYESPFDYCQQLRKVTCLSFIPPLMTDQVPLYCDMAGRELYVPALAVNIYKQTQGWDKFETILPIDYMPEEINVVGNYRLVLPDEIDASYKPTVNLIRDKMNDYYYHYGQLNVAGNATLSMKDFSMVWDNDTQRNYDNRDNYATLLGNAHLRADRVMINLVVHNEEWNFISFPFDVRMADIEPVSDGETQWVIRRYDGQRRASGETAETWVRLGQNDVLHAGEGYILQSSRYAEGRTESSSTFRVTASNNGNKNNIFRTDNASTALYAYQSEFAHNRGWNLVGNVYPAYYDTRNLDLEGNITVWDPNYRTYNAYSLQDDAYVLRPGEAFFVQCPVGAESLTFAAEGRQATHTASQNAPARAPQHDAARRQLVNLTLSDGQHTDRTRIVLTDEATTGYEVGRDAGKFMSTDRTVAQLYTTEAGVAYAINERQEGDVELSAYIGCDGQYTLTLDADVTGCQVTLEDKLMHRTVELTATKGYVFAAKAGDAADRFVLHFNTGTNAIETLGTEGEAADAYTLGGLKADKPAAGTIVIREGKKIITNQ